MNDLSNRNRNEERNPAPFIIAGLAIIAVVLGFVFMAPDESDRLNRQIPAAGEGIPSMSSDAPTTPPNQYNQPSTPDQTQP